MALPWSVYACLVVFGATGIHFFSKLAKDSIDPVVALTFTMLAGLILSLCFLPFAKSSFVDALSHTRGILFYALVGVSIVIANLGIFWMFQAGAPMSVATPIVRSAPAIFAIFLGVLFFQETLKMHHILGLLLAASGFFLLTKSYQ
ncbi:MAG: EamA family transporter [Bdellovibrionales bacterium]